ncbi:MAG: histidine--tRNA ligase [Candidatus Aureabacteria bacterium]|nr:histidine--tRNA ligase [Candidatus Auribacterota bacterium]
MKIQRPRGTADILPEEVARWHFVEDTVRRVAALYNYREIRTPIFESTELFIKSEGESTDIVSKQMYTFQDRGDRSLTLRPEMTPNVIRAYLEHSLNQKEKLTKLYYLGPIFRYEKPQAGRYRQHHQFGVEAIGCAEPALDAELVEMIMYFYGELGLAGLKAVVNSVGCTQCRPGYSALLRNYLKTKLQELCADCQRRTEVNPLRVFDCKQPLCAAAISQAPRVSDNLCDTCSGHFRTFCALLEESGIAYTVKPELVRGLDYYTRTAFEIISEDLGAQNAVGGGGRYDDLIESLGGPSVPAIGFGTGIERILMIMEERGVTFPTAGGGAVSVAVWEEECARAGRGVLRSLRRAGIGAEMDFCHGSLKSQLRRAHKSGSPFVLVLGRDELSRGMVKIKEMSTGSEQEVSLEKVGETLKGNITK